MVFILSGKSVSHGGNPSVLWSWSFLESLSLMSNRVEQTLTPGIRIALARPEALA